MQDLERIAANLGWDARLERLLNGRLRPSLALHAGDQMIGHSLAHFGDPAIALTQYFAISLQQFAIVEQLLERLPRRAADDLRVLDFACGYGRLLRLLGAAVPPERSWAADIQGPAVEFVGSRFGVHAQASAADPALFQPAVGEFDLIWVASLFSHLPDTLFHDWLARLFALLGPGGLLAFSVRGDELRPADATACDGFRYETASENAELDPAIYGTAYASEAFVLRALATACPGAPWLRLPRALANEQDLYLVAPTAWHGFDELSRLRRGPWGWTDIARVVDGRLDLQGWSASLDDGNACTVEIRVGGERHSMEPWIARPDVAAALGDPRLLNCGWSWSAPAPLAGGRPLEIDSVDRHGRRVPLYAGYPA
jgi:SAM-dependent methyltransferase